MSGNLRGRPFNGKHRIPNLFGRACLRVDRGLRLLARDACAVADPAQGYVGGFFHRVDGIVHLVFQLVERHLRDCERHPRRVIERQPLQDIL